MRINKIKIDGRTRGRIQNFVDLLAVNSNSMLIRPLLPRRFGALKKFRTSHEIPYIGRGRKMYEKALKNKNRVTL